MKQASQLEQRLESYIDLERQFNDAIELLDLAEMDGDDKLVADTENLLMSMGKHIKKLEIECLFAGEADSNDCFLEIHAGAGGVESHDYAQMLQRMYLRWAGSHNFKVEIVNEISGEEAGIKSATLKISGHNAYGWCRSETGVHRLVRNSPFNSAGKRQTSFASVWVYPIIDDTIEIEILDKDLRIDTYRASGAGGQHVNKTDSAVRITHLPTNTVVQCQNDRSQHRNRAEAFAMLKSKLYELEMKKREQEADKVNATKTDIGWGHQIRSYVLTPYQMVKDLRTDYETSNSGAVLDGDLDGFMFAYLAQEAGKRKG
jgi:peptide chain release factor 2